jgi:lysophospholipase L1-like esterase
MRRSPASDAFSTTALRKVSALVKIAAGRQIVAVSCLLMASAFTGFSPPDAAVTRGETHPVLAGKPSTPASTTSVLRIIAFGSSSTEGVGASTPSATYPAQLQSILSRLMPKGRSVEVTNRGIGGDDVDDMLKRIQDDVITRKPDIVIWQTGSNDPLRHVPLDRFERETRAGILAMRRAGAKVILMEPQWCPMLDKSGTADLYRDVIRRVADDMNVPVIHRAELMHKWIAQGLMTRGQMLAPDGLHMADSGYAELARDIAPDVLRVGGIDTPTNTALRAK